jgi:hypothetical protein
LRVTERAIRRLQMLQSEASGTPVPTRKYFHVGQPEVLEDVGECVPMIAWVDDNLSRFVLATAPSASWGRDPSAVVMSLPNLAVQHGEGVFVITGPGRDESQPHPSGQGRMHFVHLGLDRRLFDGGITSVYLYRLDGVQVKGLAGKAR